MAIGTAAAILGGAALGIGGSILGSKEQSEGIESAATTEAATSDRAIASQEKMFERTVELQEPFRQAGMEALPTLSELSRGDITETPQFKLQQEEGTEAIDKAAAARGGFGSTSTVRSIGEFNRRLLSSESDKQYGRLLDLVNIGRGAATTQGAAGMATGTNVAQTQLQTGTNLANLQVAGAQNRASTYANLGAIPTQTVNSLVQAGVF